MMLLVLTAGTALAQAPSSPRAADTTTADSLWQVGLDSVVVTATRSERKTGEVGVPVSVIGKAEIASRGAPRLSNLLADEPGLTVTSDHGSGLRMRGLGPDYTLILIDGEAVIGRTAGTLDLERLTTANVERVEVVRGPTSSLYGSEALAGVVNLITGRSNQPLTAEVRSRYGTHSTVDLSARVEGQSGPWRGSVFVDRYRTGGYDLAPQTLSPTRPGYVDYTAQARGQVDVSASTTLSLRGRLAAQSQAYTTGIDAGGSDEVPHTQRNEQRDWNAAAKVDQKLGATWRLTGTLYGAGYHTDQSLRRTDDGTLQNASALDQHHGEAEIVLRGTLGDAHLLTAGTGATVASIEADRKTGARLGGFGFVQDEWDVTETLHVIGSVRLDGNSDYASRLSPKLAARYATSERVSIRASIGSGYKAPAFRQLYLDFTNPQAGYSVFGVTEVQAGLGRLEEQGQIEALFRDPNALGDPLSPETSWAFNTGLTVTLWDGATLRLDAYHNEVSNLIDTEAVARKTNGQSVFTYVNRNEVFTRGAEARLTLRPTSALRVQLGYDYLEAKDRQVLEALEDGDVYRRVDGRDVRVSPSAYAGLPGRSAHSGTVQLRYRYSPLGLTANVQGTLRGRAGHADLDGNGIIDADREYVEARTLWDITLSKTLLDDYTLRLGTENLLGYTNPRRVPSISGRTWFAELRARF
jgi:outer membrane receptor for ferrienterochelin and colicins